MDESYPDLPSSFQPIRIDYLCDQGYVERFPVNGSTGLRILPAGEVALAEHRIAHRERLWTRWLAIIAIIVSLAALALELDDRGYLDWAKLEKTHAAQSMLPQSESQ